MSCPPAACRSCFLPSIGVLPRHGGHALSIVVFALFAHFDHEYREARLDRYELITGKEYAVPLSASETLASR